MEQLGYPMKIYQNGSKFGIESILLPGEIHATFSYEYVEEDNTIIASFKVDDEIEDIEGWEYDSFNQRYIRKYVKEFNPYNIEIKSKIDGATVVLEVNIPNEEFDKIKLKNEQEEAKRKEKWEKEMQKANNSFFLITVFIIGIIIFVILIVEIISMLSKNNKVIKNKAKPKSFKKKFIIVGLILIVLSILFML